MLVQWNQYYAELLHKQSNVGFILAPYSVIFDHSKGQGVQKPIITKLSSFKSMLIVICCIVVFGRNLVSILDLLHYIKLFFQIVFSSLFQKCALSKTDDTCDKEHFWMKSKIINSPAYLWCKYNSSPKMTLWELDSCITSKFKGLCNWK